jgi:hypothetical protein
VKTYKFSDLTHKRAEVMQEVKQNGVILQQLERNGTVREEFVLLSVDSIKNIDSEEIVWFDNDGNHLVKG